VDLLAFGVDMSATGAGVTMLGELFRHYHHTPPIGFDWKNCMSSHITAITAAVDKKQFRHSRQGITG
jgi:hypothetical protein